MNDIVGHTDTVRVVGGLSIGGAIAARAIQLDPALYSRGILFAPFFDLAGVLPGSALDLINSIKERFKIHDPLIKHRIGWGLGCIEENKAGRAGICEFLPDNVIAINSFGGQTRRLASKTKTKVQIVVSEVDNTAAPESVREYTTAMKQKNLVAEGKPNVSGCFYKQPVPHSMISRTDNPKEDKFWLDALLNDSKRFIIDNEFFLVSNELHRFKDMPYCKNQK